MTDSMTPNTVEVICLTARTRSAEPSVCDRSVVLPALLVILQQSDRQKS